MYFHALGSDVRYCFRGLFRDRAFTLVAVTSLALGMAANISIFGIMDTLLWRELPVAQPEQLVSFENTSRSYFGYLEFAKHAEDALQDVLAQSRQANSVIDLGSGPTRGAIEFVSNNSFGALGMPPVYGRLELRDSDRAAVISYAYWRRAFNSDPSVIGHSIHVGEGGFRVIGVAPEDFFGLTVGEAPDIWLPISAQPAVSPTANWLAGRNNNWLELFGRLRQGVTIQRAEAILAPVSLGIDIERSGRAPTAAERKQMLQDPMKLAPALRAKNGRSIRLSDVTAAAKAENSSIRIDSFESANELLNGTLDTDRLMARLGWALGILSVSLASVGIYGLVSYDVTRRTGEIGIRTALGAVWTDIIRLVLSEVVLIALFGIGLGGLSAIALSGLVRGMIFGLSVHDPRFEIEAAAVLLVVAFSAAAIPARRAARLDPCERCARSD